METKPLAAIMEEKGLNQVQLAELSEVAQSTLSYMIRGKHKPRKRIQRDIAAALGVEREEIEEFGNG